MGNSIHEHGNRSTSESHWVLLTKAIIPGSKSERNYVFIKEIYARGHELLQSYCQKAQISYEVPQLFDTAVSIFAAYVSTGIRYFANGSLTVCQEEICVGYLANKTEEQSKDFCNNLCVCDSVGDGEDNYSLFGIGASRRL
jgi:hypothetical protein